MLEEDFKNYVTINTHRELYWYFSPSNFPERNERDSQRHPGQSGLHQQCINHRQNSRGHLKLLELVLAQLEEDGLSLRRDQCIYMLTKVEYLGHIMSTNSLQTSEKKIKAIIDSPSPQNIAQLKSFLRIINYCGEFLKHLSSQLVPQHRRLR